MNKLTLIIWFFILIPSIIADDAKITDNVFSKLNQQNTIIGICLADF